MIPPTAGGLNGMSKVTCQISVSLDGYVAGPNQSLDDPLGEGGERLHEWAFATDGWREQHGRSGGERNADSEVDRGGRPGVGAFIMGRKMFGGGAGRGTRRGAAGGARTRRSTCRSSSLTHHPREPLACRAARRSTFVTDGIESALEQARAAAGDDDVMIAGGAKRRAAVPRRRAARRALPPHRPGRARRRRAAARRRRRPALEPVEVVASPAVTHVKYRVVR